MIVINRIRELREELGAKQSWLAAKLHISQVAVSNYELGHRDPPVDTILLLCDLFGVSSDYLIGRSDNRNSALSGQDAELLQSFHAAPLTIQTAITTLLSPYMTGKGQKNTSAG